MPSTSSSIIVSTSLHCFKMPGLIRYLNNIAYHLKISKLYIGMRYSKFVVLAMMMRAIRKRSVLTTKCMHLMSAKEAGSYCTNFETSSIFVLLSALERILKRICLLMWRVYYSLVVVQHKVESPACLPLLWAMLYSIKCRDKCLMDMRMIQQRVRKS